MSVQKHNLTVNLLDIASLTALSVEQKCILYLDKDAASAMLLAISSISKTVVVVLTFSVSCHGCLEK